MPRLTCHHGYFQPLGGSALHSGQDHSFTEGDGCNTAPCRGGFCYLLLGPFCPQLISLLLVGEGLCEWKPISLLFIPGHFLGGEERGSSFSQLLRKAISPAFLKAVKLRLSKLRGSLRGARALARKTIRAEFLFFSAPLQSLFLLILIFIYAFSCTGS